MTNAIPLPTKPEIEPPPDQPKIPNPVPEIFPEPERTQPNKPSPEIIPQTQNPEITPIKET
jgi:hypothetical protein